MIRAFIAVSLDAKTIEAICAATGELKKELAGVRWIGKENLHVTLKFLGSVDEARLDQISSAVADALRPFSRCTINAKGLGVFPGPKKPRVLWVGLESEELAALASSIENALQPLGFAPEARSFTPHLTVGRWREFTGSAASLQREIEKWQRYDFGVSSVAEVTLFQSVLKPTGAVYHPLQSIALGEKPLR